MVAEVASRLVLRLFRNSGILVLLLIATSLGEAAAADPVSPRGLRVEERGYVGISISDPQIGFRKDFRIVEVVAGSPAAAAGIQPGDYIVAVDGELTAGLQSNLQLSHILQGPPDSVLRLVLRRADDGRMEAVSVTRAKKWKSASFPK